MNSFKTITGVTILLLASQGSLVEGAGKPGSGGALSRATLEATALAQPAGVGQATQPELKSVKIDFVPGEKTIFFDDFSDMAADEPPPHWKVRDGKVELRTGGNVRELYSQEGVTLTTGSIAVPKNFTFELEWTGGGEMVWTFRDKDDTELLKAIVRGEEDGKTASTTVSVASGDLGNGQIDADTNQSVEFSLWAQQGRIRAYLNGQRLVDANQVDFGQIDHISVEDSRYRPNGLRRVRVADSAPDFSSVLAATGKYVTHGINFDTNSDRLKPESAAVIKMVAAGLEKNPNLKLEIEGYTDSVGDANHNLDLSKRRAEAVRSVLVSQFGVDAGRLTAAGFGAAKPIGSNDTADGRAQNRRVEFLKK
jgi:OOP family OmpA-OmpF porin